MDLKIKRYFYRFLIALIIIGVFHSNSFLNSFSLKNNSLKLVYLKDSGIEGRVYTSASTVAGFLEEQKIKLNPKDIIYPSFNTSLSNNLHITIQRAKHFQIIVGQEKKEGFTQSVNVGNLLKSQGISIKKEDIIKPNIKTFVYNNIKIEVIVVETKEKIIQQSIKYKTKTIIDKKISWRKRIIKQKGKNGLKNIYYQEVFYNNKKISSQKIKEEIIKKPKEEIIIQGGYVKLGKSHRGQASWYHFTGKMTAANPWLPLGSYVKVTNLANKKSVIVKIVDRGPFGKGRIIDLEKTAFAQIAPLGAGVINVKMEEIKN